MLLDSISSRDNRQEEETLFYHLSEDVVFVNLSNDRCSTDLTYIFEFST